MSRIIQLNEQIGFNNPAYCLYALDSHGEITIILEHLGKLIYANILGVMTTHDLSKQNKEYAEIIDQVKDFIKNPESE